MSKNPTKGAEPVAQKKEETKPAAEPAKGAKAPADTGKAPADQNKSGKPDATKAGDGQSERKSQLVPPPQDRKSQLLLPPGTPGPADSQKTPATSSTNLIKQPEGAPVKSKDDKKQAQINIPQPVVAQKPKPPSILKESGLIDAYDHFLRQLCKNGLPSGNIFEYAAQEIVKFEKKRKMDIAKKNAIKQEREASPLKQSAVQGQKPLGKDQGDKNKQKDAGKPKDQPNNKDIKDKEKDSGKDAKPQQKDGKADPKKPNDTKDNKPAEQPKGKDEKPKKK